MELTIQLDDPLASQLHDRASASQLPPQEYARRLLGEALQSLDESAKWDTQNRRRIALIRKSVHEGLAIDEQAELQSLQEAADQRLEARDRQLLDELARFKEAVERLPKGTE